ncbi:MAG: hypothetical protein K2X93_25240 [Candidatus Obscuribacterales bacterium]|nr:hypothetical protein [Candidatus Obscuribacterales bacterium]
MTQSVGDWVSISASVEKENQDPVGYLKPFVDPGTIAGIRTFPIVGGFACGTPTGSWK